MPEHVQPSEPPRRLRASDFIAEYREIVARLTERGGGERSTVELSRNAKGETQIAVTVRTDDEELSTAELARVEAVRIYEDLCKRFPAGSGYARNEGQKS